MQPAGGRLRPQGLTFWLSSTVLSEERAYSVEAWYGRSGCKGRHPVSRLFLSATEPLRSLHMPTTYLWLTKCTHASDATGGLQ